MEWFSWGHANEANPLASISRVTAASFHVKGTDVTSLYLADLRLKFLDTTTLYGTVVSSSFSTDTTVTVTLDSGSLTASLSQVALAIIKPTNRSLPNNLVSNPNVVIGGNFDTNPWQRGTTFTSVATDAYTADRFRWVQVGAGVVSIIKTADAPTVTQAGIFTQNCFHVDVTTADGSIASTDIYRIYHAIEGYDFTQLAQRPFTISFWVKSTLTGIFCVSVNNTGQDRSYIAEYTVDTTDTWEYKTVIIPASPSAGTWDYTTGAGIYLTFTISSGTDFHGTGSAWTTQTAKYATSNQVNGMDSTSYNFKLALIKVEKGSVATSYPIEIKSDILSKCQRYYAKTFEQATAPIQNVGSINGSLMYTIATAGASARVETWEFPVIMRITPPTITYYNPNAADTLWWNNADVASSGASSTVQVDQRRIVVANAQVAGDGVTETVSIHVSVDAEL